MIRHCGDVGAYASCGIHQAGPVLDLHTHNSVGVVTAPDLGTVEQHPGIEPPTARGRVLQEYVWELLQQAPLELIHPQYISVTRL